MRGLLGKIAIVAGGATGIGAATSVRLAEEGATVVVGDIDGDGAERVAARVAQAGGRAMGIQFDVADDASVHNFVKKAVETYGGLDFMHANAADLSLCANDTDAVTISLDIFDRTIAVNLRGYLLCTRHAVPELLKRGGGAIIYTSSGAAFVGESERVAYGISKAGINALMRHVATRWGKDGIRANAIAPGFILTEAAMAQVPEETRQVLLGAGRSTRLGYPEDIANMVAMLASADGEWINGQVISVDGGITMR